jgi:hypothetical protein
MRDQDKVSSWWLVSFHPPSWVDKISACIEPHRFGLQVYLQINKNAQTTRTINFQILESVVCFCTQLCIPLHLQGNGGTPSSPSLLDLDNSVVMMDSFRTDSCGQATNLTQEVPEEKQGRRT